VSTKIGYPVNMLLLRHYLYNQSEHLIRLRSPVIPLQIWDIIGPAEQAYGSENNAFEKGLLQKSEPCWMDILID